MNKPIDTGSASNQDGVFKFYLDGEKTGDRFSLFKTWDKGVILAVLTGINIATGGKKFRVEPCYKPLLIIDIRPGITRVEILSMRMLFMRRKPFLFIERLGKDREEED